MGTIYNNNNNGDIEFVRGSRNRCKALDNAHLNEGGTEELLFAKDTGTIISGGVEYGRGVFIPTLSSEATTKQAFGNLPAGTKMSDLQFKDISAILEEALFSDPVRVEGEFTPVSITAQVQHSSRVFEPNTKMGTVKFTVTTDNASSFINAQIDGTAVSPTLNVFTKDITLADLKTAFATDYTNNPSNVKSTVISNGEISIQGVDGFNTFNLFIWNFESPTDYTVEKPIKLTYKTTNEGATKVVTVNAEITFPKYNSPKAPKVVTPIRNVPAFNFTATAGPNTKNLNDITFTPTELPLVIKCEKALNALNDIDYTEAYIRYSKSGNIVEGSNAFALANTNNTTYDCYAVTSASGTISSPVNTDETKVNSNITFNEFLWTNSEGLSVTFTHIPAITLVLIPNGYLLNGKLLNESGLYALSGDYGDQSAAITITSANQGSRTFKVKGYYPIQVMLGGINRESRKLYKNTLTLSLNLDLGQNLKASLLQTLQLQGLPNNLRISDATIISYTGTDKLGTDHDLKANTSVSIPNFNTVSLGNSDTTAYDINLKITITIVEVTNNN